MDGRHRQTRQGWLETVRVIARSTEESARTTAQTDAYYAARRERAAKSRKEPATAAQLKYLSVLVAKAGRERFDAEYDKAVKGTGVAAHGADERTQQALGRLTKAAARKLITALAGP